MVETKNDPLLRCRHGDLGGADLKTLRVKKLEGALRWIKAAHNQTRPK
jgi:hypothetical protein